MVELVCAVQAAFQLMENERSSLCDFEVLVGIAHLKAVSPCSAPIMIR
jgi:hypothetical protein